MSAPCNWLKALVRVMRTPPCLRKNHYAFFSSVISQSGFSWPGRAFAFLVDEYISLRVAD
jgi:hypothetical protein